VAGNTVYALSQWAVFSILTKTTTLEVVGRFALGLAITAPVFLFANLQLRSLQATDVSGRTAFSDYFGLRLATTSGALLFIAITTLVGRYSPALASVILLLALSKAIDALVDVCHGELQRRERFNSIASSTVLRSLMSLVGFTIAATLTGSLPLAIVGMCIGSLITLIFYDAGTLSTINSLHPLPRTTASPVFSVTFISSLRPTWRRARLHEILSTALPLGIVTLLSSLNVNIPRYFVGSHCGSATLGVYASLTAVVTGLYVIQIAVSQAVLPRLSRHFVEGDRWAFLKIATFVVAFGTSNGLFIVLLSVFGGAHFLRLLFSHEFIASTPLFTLIAVVSIVQCVNGALGFLLQAARLFRKTVPASLAATLVISLTSYLLVPSFGAVGAVCAVLAGTLASCLLLTIHLLIAWLNLPDSSHET
jgi:O-antigen/teichoic acid export membrane protein